MQLANCANGFLSPLYVVLSDRSIQPSESLVWHLELCLIQVQRKICLSFALHPAGCLEVAHCCYTKVVSFRTFRIGLPGGGYLSITVKKISMTDISLCRGSYPQPLPPHPRPTASAKLIFLCNLLFSRSSCWRLSAPLKPLATRKGLNMPSRVCSSLTCHQIRNQMGITREGKISSKGDTVSLKARLKYW